MRLEQRVAEEEEREKAEKAVLARKADSERWHLLMARRNERRQAYADKKRTSMALAESLNLSVRKAPNNACGHGAHGLDWP
jgi:hypothetical protein